MDLLKTAEEAGGQIFVCMISTFGLKTVSVPISKPNSSAPCGTTFWLGFTA
jgi:hypothetical protein